MLNIFDLEDINLPKFFRNIFFCLTVFLGMLVPGFLFLFLYSRDLFINLNVIKLVLLSIVLSAPVNFINYMIVDTKIIINDIKETDTNKSLGLAMIIGGTVSNLATVLLVVLYYLTSLPVRNLNDGFRWLILTNFLIVASLILGKKIEKIRNRKK